MEYTETDFISPGLKRLIGITSIHFSDRQAVEYLYQLFQVNIGEKTLMNVGHRISKESENWQHKSRMKIKITKDNTRFALGLMDYSTYIKMNLPIGSGVIESAIKYICNKRLKNNSACRLIKSVRDLLKLRIIWFNNYFDDFWE